MLPCVAVYMLPCVALYMLPSVALYASLSGFVCFKLDAFKIPLNEGHLIE